MWGWPDQPSGLPWPNAGDGGVLAVAKDGKGFALLIGGIVPMSHAPSLELGGLLYTIRLLSSNPTLVSNPSTDSTIEHPERAPISLVSRTHHGGHNQANRLMGEESSEKI